MVSIKATFKRKFLAGLIVSIPAVLTLFLVIWFFKAVDGILGPIYDKLLGYHVAGLGFISAIVLITAIGIVSTNVFGKRIIRGLEKILMQIPVLKGIYASIKQFVDAFSPESQVSSFKKLVIVQYPRKDCYAYGFLTKECAVEAKDKSLNLKTIYIPTNHLYLGDIAMFREEDVFYTNIPVEEGIKIILSGGVAAPPRITGEKE